MIFFQNYERGRFRYRNYRLDFKLGDRVIEVGVELINHVSTGKTLQFYCSVEKKIH